MTFQFAATTDKASSIRKALTDKRDTQLSDLRRAEEEGQPDQQPPPGLRDQLEGDLVEAAIAAAEAGLRKLKGYSNFQVTVAGNDPDDGSAPSFSVAVVAVP